MKKAKHFFFVVIGVFFTSSSLAQNVTPAILNASGGTYGFSYYRFEWSFGEAMAIETIGSSSTMYVTQGVLQPETNTPATIYNTDNWDRDEIKILPNPTQNVIEIDFFSKQRGKVVLSLYDEIGRFLSKREFDYYGTGRIEKWNLAQFPNGTYMLNIRLNPVTGYVSKNGTFKVIKAN